MPKLAKRRVAMYARVSTLDQDPQMQIRELRSYAKLRAFIIAHEFIDHVSGATSERPELSKLWHTARARKIDTVLVWKFNRFARSTKQLIEGIHLRRDTRCHNGFRALKSWPPVTGIPGVFE
jgi:DNA invertase Pin-like site-specific DNA recombinase